MSRGLKIAMAAGGVVLALLVAGTAVTGFALAQDPDPDQSGNETFLGQRMGRHGGRRMEGVEPMGGPPEEMAEAIAGVLGMTAEELESALAEGQTLFDIVEEQGVDLADVQAAMEAARREHLETMIDEAPPAGWMLLYHDEMEQAVADALNISVDELEAGRAEGKHLFEIAEEQGLDPETVHEALEAAREGIVDQAVADGVLTEEQAEEMTEFGPGFGGPGGPGGQRGRGGRGRPEECGGRPDTFGGSDGMPQRGGPFGRNR